MKRIASLVVCLVSAAFMTVADAAVRVVACHNVHIAVSNVEAAVDSYAAYLGGVRSFPGAPDVFVGQVKIVFVETAEVRMSNGSVIDHIGLTHADLDATMRGLEAAGATIVSPIHDVSGSFRRAIIEDPWGARIELLEDPHAPISRLTRWCAWSCSRTPTA